MKCKFHKTCPYFRKENVVCTQKGEVYASLDYCGQYLRLEKISHKKKK